MTVIKFEGFWRGSLEDSDELPWPSPDDDWGDREKFMFLLDQAERLCERIAYRGHSSCRLCHAKNGFESLRLDGWEWPSGFRHYVEVHGVRPTRAFEAFILNR